MPVARAGAGEEGDLDRAQQLNAAELRARRVECLDPAAQLAGGDRRERGLELAATRRIHRRLVGERTHERTDPESGPAHDQCGLVPRLGLGDPPDGIRREARC